MEELRNKIFKILQEEFGEYSHFEVKEQASWNTLEKKAEFIRDMQSLCNSFTDEPSRYLVIGYNKHTRTFKDVTDFDNFDEGKLRDFFSKYFEPEISVKSHCFTTDNNEHFIVLEFPTKNLQPPHVIKTEIKNNNKERFLEHGEIWIKGGGKGGSSAKRRATSDDIRGMFERQFDIEAEKRAQVRFELHQEENKLKLDVKELISAENLDISAIYRLDETFIKSIRQLVLENKSASVRSLVEDIKDNLISSWEQVNRRKHHDVDEEKVYNIKINHLNPSFRKLVLIATTLIKLREFPSIFDSILQVLSDIYARGANIEYGIESQLNRKYPDIYLSFALPSIECETAFYLIGAYALKSNNVSYLNKLLNTKTYWQTGEPQRHMAFMLLRGNDSFLNIPELRTNSPYIFKNSIELFSERGSSSDKGSYLIPNFFIEKDELTQFLASFDFIIALNSDVLFRKWVSIREQRAKEFEKQKTTLPQNTSEYEIKSLGNEIMGEYYYHDEASPFKYYPQCISIPQSNIALVVERLIDLYQSKKYEELKQFFIDDKHFNLDLTKFDLRLYYTLIGLFEKSAKQGFRGWIAGRGNMAIQYFLKDTKDKYKL